LHLKTLQEAISLEACENKQHFIKLLFEVGFSYNEILECGYLKHEIRKVKTHVK
jgi:hypothetical protein